MKNKFEFGDIVYHKSYGKGVYLGSSQKLYPSTFDEDCDSVEVVYESRATPFTCNLEHLSSEEFVISFTDDQGDTYAFTKPTSDVLSVRYNNEPHLAFLIKDIDRFIDCLVQFKDRHTNN